MTKSAPKFNGPDYKPARDNCRLTSQNARIFEVMKSGKALTLFEISELTGEPEASISAQLRHLRKPRFGSHGVSKQYLGGGLYAYQVHPNSK